MRWFRDVKIPIPKIDEQHKIVKYLNDLQKKLILVNNLQIETQSEFKKLKASIINNQFLITKEN